jgi:hypothetical protein
VVFTKLAVDAFTCPPGRKDAWVFDSNDRGFAVRVTSTGSKVFYLQYYVGGQVKRLRLGAYARGPPTPRMLPLPCTLRNRWRHAIASHPRCSAFCGMARCMKRQCGNGPCTSPRMLRSIGTGSA